MHPHPWPRPLAALLMLAALGLLAVGAQPLALAAPTANALGGTWTTFAHGNSVWALARDGNTLWAATWGGGVVAWQLTDATYSQYLAPQTPLAGNEVRDVVVDRLGNRWLATQRGLSRLDPAGGWTTFTVESTGGGLPSNNVTALAVGSDGALWVGAAQDRRLALAGECDGPPTPVGGPNLHCDGLVYFGGGVARLSGGEWTTWRAPAAPYTQGTGEVVAANITDLAVDPTTGTVWATAWPSWRWSTPDRATRGPAAQGTWALDGAGGISAYDPARSAWTHYQHNPDRDPGGAPTWPKVNAVTAVTVDAVGTKWLGVRGRGVQRLDGAGWTEHTPAAQPLLDDMVLALAVDAGGRVWAAVADTVGNGRGVAVLDPQQGTWRGLGAETGLNGTTVRAILPDGDGVWLGYTDRRGNGAGVDYVGGAAVTQRLRTAGLPSNNITALAVRDNGELWVGTGRRDDSLYGAGIGVRAADGGWRTHAAEVRPGERVGVLAEAHTAGSALLAVTALAYPCDAIPGLGRGLLVGDDPRPYPVGLTYADSERCAIVLDEGLRADAPAGTPLHLVAPSLPSGAIGSIAFDTAGRPWVAVQGEQVDPVTFHYRDGGLSVLDGERWTTHTAAPPDAPGLPTNAVAAALPRPADCAGHPEMWVGTGSAALLRGGGVSVLNLLTGAWRRVDEAGLSASNVSALALDPLRCDVWAATLPSLDDAGQFRGGGLSHWQTGAGRWVVYDTANAARLVAFRDAFASVLADRAGRVWAGTATHHSRRPDPGSTEPCWECAPDWLRYQRYTDAVVNLFVDGAWASATTWQHQGAVAALAEDAYGRVWVGLSRGWLADDATAPDLAYARDFVGGGVRVRAGKWLSVDPLNSAMADGNVQALAAAPDGTVWVGTANRGLLRWQPDAAAPPTATPPLTRTPVATSTPRPTATPRPGYRRYVPYLVLGAGGGS